MEQTGELEDFADVSGGVHELEAAAGALKRDERTDERAEAGAIHLRHANEIDEEFAGAAVELFAKLVAQEIVAATDGDAPLQIENGDVAHLTGGDLQAHGNLL